MEALPFLPTQRGYRQLRTRFFRPPLSGRDMRPLPASGPSSTRNIDSAARDWWHNRVPSGCRTPRISECSSESPLADFVPRCQVLGYGSRADHSLWSRSCGLRLPVALRDRLYPCASLPQRRGRWSASAPVPDGQTAIRYAPGLSLWSSSSSSSRDDLFRRAPESARHGEDRSERSAVLAWP